MLARNFKYDSFSRTGETCHAKSYFFVQEVARGLVFLSGCVGESEGASRCPPEARLLRRAVCGARQTSGLLCVVHRQQHHVRDRARTLEHVALLRSERSARLPQQARVHCWHVAFPPLRRPFHGSPAPPAIFGHGADVIGWLKCLDGQSVLYALAGTPREKLRMATAEAKTATATTPSAKKTRQLMTACQEPEVFSATAQDNSRETPFFRRSALLRDICAEGHSRRALVKHGGSGRILPRTFLLEEEAAPRPCGHPTAANKFTGRKGAQVLVSSTKTHQGHVDARDQGSKENTSLQSVLRRVVLRATVHTIQWCRSRTQAPRFTMVLSQTTSPSTSTTIW